MKSNAKKIVIEEVSPRNNRTVFSAPAELCSNRDSAAEMALDDMHRLAAHLNLTMESLYDKYCIPVLDEENGGPRMVVLRKGYDNKRCPFEKDGVCTLGEKKPSSCRMAPLIRNMIPAREGVWRVGYFVSSEKTASGTVKYSATDLLKAANANGTELAYGHMHMAFYEVYKHCALLTELTGKSIEPLVVIRAMRRFMTVWDDRKSSGENAAKNHKEFKESLWALTEPRLEEAYKSLDSFSFGH